MSKRYAVVLGNQWGGPPSDNRRANELLSTCDTLEGAQALLKRIEGKLGPNRYDGSDPNSIAYGKEECFFIKEVPHNDLPDWIKEHVPSD